MTKETLIHEELSRAVIGAFYDCYNELGFGFLEQIYAAALELELQERGYRVEREARVPVTYKSRVLGLQRLDMIVDRKIVIEIKSTASLHPNATRQLFNYLKGTGLELGMLLHFGREPHFLPVAFSRY